MSKPFKFQYANQIAGAFFLISVAIIIFVGAFSARMKGWMDKERIFYVGLPPAGTQGIRPGSEVRVMGRPVGTITNIENGLVIKGEAGQPDTFKRVERLSDVAEGDRGNRRVIAQMAIHEDAIALIGKDSVAKLQNDLGGLGAAFFEIVPGAIPLDIDLPESHDEFIPFEETKDAMVSLNDRIKELEDPIKEAKKGLQNFNHIVGEEGTLTKTLKSLEKTLEVVAETTNDPNKGMLYALLPKAADELTSSIAGINKSVEAGQVMNLLLEDDTVTDLEATIANFKKATNRLNLALDKLPRTIDKTDDAIEELDAAAVEARYLVEGVQEFWLFRKKVSEVKEKEAEANGVPARAKKEATSAPTAPDAKPKSRFSSVRKR